MTRPRRVRLGASSAATLLLAAALSGTTGPQPVDPQASTGTPLGAATIARDGATLVMKGAADPQQASGPVRARLSAPAGRSGHARPSWQATARGAVSNDGQWEIRVDTTSAPQQRSITIQLALRLTDGTTAMQVTQVRLVELPEVAATPAHDGQAQPGGNPDSYAYLVTGTDGQPARWSSCAPIPYYLNTATVPEGLEQVVHAAFARAAEDTGIQFTYAGPTSHTPFTGNGNSRPTDRGDGIYVAFSDPQAAPRLTGAVAGLGAPYADLRDPSPEIRTGAILLDRTAGLAADTLTGNSLVAVLTHELGHVLNLAHVADPEQLMHPMRMWNAAATLQRGDLHGIENTTTRDCR